MVQVNPLTHRLLATSGLWFLHGSLEGGICP